MSLQRKPLQRVLTTLHDDGGQSLHACTEISYKTFTGMHDYVYTHDTPGVVGGLELDGSPLATVQQT